MKKRAQKDRKKPVKETASQPQQQATNTAIVIPEDSITAQRAAEFGLPPRGNRESLASFRMRIAGDLRNMGRVIESHEAATGRLYNDQEATGFDTPATGIIGAVAQAMQGVDYHQEGERQVSIDAAAGFYIQRRRPSALEGMAPEALILMAALFGGR